MYANSFSEDLSGPIVDRSKNSNHQERSGEKVSRFICFLIFPRCAVVFCFVPFETIFYEWLLMGSLTEINSFSFIHEPEIKNS